MTISPTTDKLDVDMKFLKQVQRMMIDNGDTLNNCINLMKADALHGIMATTFEQTAERERMYNQLVIMDQFSNMVKNMVDAASEKKEDEDDE